MKKILLGATLFSALLLASCGGESKEKIEGSVESTAAVENTAKESTSEEAASNDIKTEYNQEIADDENIKISLMNIEHISNKDYNEEKYVVSFDVTNKRSETIAVQAREVSINNRMVDESLLNMSTDIAGGKSATAKLEIQDYTGGELPELTGNLEMILHTFDWDSMENSHDVPVSITIK